MNHGSAAVAVVLVVVSVPARSPERAAALPPRRGPAEVRAALPARARDSRARVNCRTPRARWPPERPRGRTRSTTAMPIRKTAAGTTTHSRIQKRVTPQGRPTSHGCSASTLPPYRSATV